MIRVAVLRGGPSSEYDVSLKTGANVIKALAGRFIVKDILIDKQGVWHMDGLPILPALIAEHTDVALNAMHGEYGEDGKVQAILDRFKMPYTGSTSWPSAVAMNKTIAKEYFRREGIRTPHGVVVEKTEDLDEAAAYVFSKVSPSWFVKPEACGSSVGVTPAKTMDDLKRGLAEAFKYSDRAIVEERIKGREATSGVFEDFRGQKHYPTLPIEILKPSHKEFFDYECKYDGTSKEICPGNFSPKEKQELQDLAVKIHKILGLRHYSRSDFIVTPHAIYALEVNTLPGLTSESLFPKMMDAVGCSYPEFLSHLINLALAKK